MDQNNPIRPAYPAAYAILFSLCLMLAFMVSHGTKNFSEWLGPIFLPVWPAVVVLKVGVFGFLGLFREWPTSFRRLFQASWLSTLVMVIAFFMADYLASNAFPNNKDSFPFDRFRQNIFLLDFIFTLVLVWLAGYPLRSADRPADPPENSR